MNKSIGMATNDFLQNGYMENEHFFLAAQQRLVYEILVIFQI